MESIVRRILALGFLVINVISGATGSGGYSYADCTYVNPGYSSTYYGGRCFCYTSPGIKWKDYWSTFQVKVSSDDDVVIVYPMEPPPCRHGDNLQQLTACLMEHYWPSSVQKEKGVVIPLVKEEVFFMTKAPRASAQYTLHVSKHRFNMLRFFFFVSGLVLFFFAGAVSRSSIFFYVSGISLGTVSIFLFLLVVLRNSIPLRGMFLLLFATAGLSYLSIRMLIDENNEIMRLYWRELLGYLLVSGVVSLLVCLRQGAFTSRRTLSVMTWALQVVGVALACHGVTYAPVSWFLLTLLLGLKVLRLLLTLVLAVWRQLCWLLWRFLALFGVRGRCKSRLLTEEEYQEQAERHTRASLEELRSYCSNPGFPAWETVLRLRAPQRFAEFLHGGAHVTPSEMQSYELHRRGGFIPEHDENTFPDSSPTRANSSRIDTHTHQTPNPGCSFPPLPPALQCPAAYTAPICPYPPTQHTPTTPPPSAPECPRTDDDEPF